MNDFVPQMECIESTIRGWPEMFPEGPAAAQPELLTQITFKYLWTEVFAVRVFGASDLELSLLQYLYNGMHVLEPKKGQANL